jgi:DNA polymerase III subunit epsilon
MWSWFSRWRPELTPEISQRLAHWAAQPAADLHIPLDSAKFTVIDLETTGFDPSRDALLSIGAVRINGRTLSLGESFHCLVASERTGSRDNVLVHGIAPSQQAMGEAPQTCLMQLLEFSGKEPLMAFHAPFDRAFLVKAVRRWLGVRLKNPFVDVAWLLPALFPSALAPRAGLDDWAQHFNLSIPRRHSADADALATAELTLVALAEARRRRVRDLRALVTHARHMAHLSPLG